MKEHDQVLTKRLASGDLKAFDEIYEKYYSKVYAFSSSYLKNKEESEGVVQDVFTTLWLKRAEMKEIRNLQGWLFTITFNHVRKIFRNLAIKRRNLDAYGLLGVTEDSSTMNTVEYNDLLAKAEQQIEKLSPRQRDILLLQVKEGLDSEEIAHRLHIHKRTVDNHLNNARNALLTILRDEQIITFLLLWFLL
ncbi:MAG: sigma-70 family RNA polymerase sigma factor [Bacteroidales bacterium]|nr:sigma-70 family RNA polymerase sigma factor [Bacteroidales bacterium]